jgi:hypothetical protein
VTLSSVGAVLVQGESHDALVSAVLLTIFIELCCLSLSDGGLSDRIGRTRGADPVLERAKDLISIDLESDGSHGRIPGALSGSLGLACGCKVRSHLYSFDSWANELGIRGNWAFLCANRGCLEQTAATVKVV